MITVVKYEPGRYDTMSYNIVSNASPFPMELVGGQTFAGVADVWYDRRAEALGLRLRSGEPRRVLVGRGTFVIYADDHGVWGIDIEVERWDRDPAEVDRALAESGVRIYG
ncbi:conserved hypothetical protein [Pyrobaculum islandicum DSM 4184]|uniref:Uncharacterized protein n=1 Tax=Pyrobaculum islandicum (strain DSM 4184 / JCM 9189 / GEO3) TaxID=384616 RepID=A1RUJ6_PYRIL|nr:hypothetical protein [Pyrobaculum islandicum]ABL88628.1 conserved hypothetical protein [Pyrobaculum islandicum DSM 4184]